jgi:sugar phosphate isomerase/epimerase
VKIAVENHGGDLHSLELARLIEEAGPDFVGANMDSGNAVSALEDPLENLENLGRYAITTSLRDSAAWETDRGATMQWTAMGEGQVDWKRYFTRFAELCPETPVNIETISGRNIEIPFKTDAFKKAWPHGRPKGFDRFLAFVKRGVPRAQRKRPEGIDRAKADQQYQRSELERSIAWCRRLGLGRR